MALTVWNRLKFKWLVCSKMKVHCKINLTHELKPSVNEYSPPIWKNGTRIKKGESLGEGCRREFGRGFGEKYNILAKEWNL